VVLAFVHSPLWCTHCCPCTQQWLLHDKSAAYEKTHLSDITSGHELGFGGVEGNGWLKFSFVCNGAAGKLDADATE
jgi:hypothetical protein